MGGGFPYLASSTGRALSLLSSKTTDYSLVSPSESDLSSRSSAALRELIAENRAAILARQLILDRDTWQPPDHHPPGNQDFGAEAPAQRSGGASTVFSTIESNHHQMFPEPQEGWERINGNGTHVTLNLMQAPSPAFGTFMSSRGSKTKVEDEDCSAHHHHHLWNSFQGHSLV